MSRNIAEFLKIKVFGKYRKADLLYLIIYPQEYTFFPWFSFFLDGKSIWFYSVREIVKKRCTDKVKTMQFLTFLCTS